MDNHGVPKQFNDNVLVRTIAKFLEHDRSEFSVIPKHSTCSLLKRRTGLTKKGGLRKERSSLHKVCYYSWTSCWSLRALLTSFGLGDMELLRISFRIMVSSVILDSYGSVLLGGDNFD